MTSKGVTLIELIVVISIIGILAIALGFSYVGWQGRYKVEKTTKDLYTDLMNARGMAMTRNRVYFADFPTATSYRIMADANDNSAADDAPLATFPKTVEYVLNGNGAGIPGTTFTFDKRGLISPSRTICMFTTNDPDYDCIIISETRINMGKIINQGNACNANNCEPK